MSMTPHDALFKGIFEQPRRAAELLRHALPPGVSRLLDFTTLKQEHASFTDATLAQRHTDLLFSARVVGHDLEVRALLEYQSRDERRMPLRILDYMTCLWRTSPRSHLSPILSVVLHHSAAGWRSPTAFESLLGPDLPPEFREYIPRFRFTLLDLGTLSDEALMQADLSPTSRLTLSALKHARSTADLRPLVAGWTQLVREVLRAQIFRYLSLVRGRGDIPILEQIAAPAVAEVTMQTIAEYYEEKYMQQGLEKGQALGLEKGLAKGLEKGIPLGEQKLLLRQLRYRFGELPATTLEKVTTADEPLLERWAERLLGAHTLDEVFG